MSTRPACAIVGCSTAAHVYMDDELGSIWPLCTQHKLEGQGFAWQSKPKRQDAAVPSDEWEAFRREQGLP